MIDISVIIPVFNQGNRILNAIESAFMPPSDSLEIEVIVVNDCSTDDSSSLISAAQTRYANLRSITFPHNMGAGPARNAGLEVAKGKYVTFLDPDDVYPRGALQKLYWNAENSKLDLVRGNITEFDSSGIGHSRYSNSYVTGVYKFADTPILWAPWMHQQFIFRREFLNKHSIRYPNLRRGQDSVMLARSLALAKYVFIIEDVVYHYFIGVKSMQWGWKQYDNILDHFIMVRDAYVKNGFTFQWINYLNAYWNFWRYLQNGAANNFSDEQLKNFIIKSSNLFIDVDTSFFNVDTHKLFPINPWRMLIYMLLRQKKFDLLFCLLRSNIRIDELLKSINFLVSPKYIHKISDESNIL